MYKEQIITNCPNCGAPIDGYKCEYCGTTLHTGWSKERLESIYQLEIKYRQSKIEELKKEIQQASFQEYNTYLRSLIMQSLQYPLESLQYPLGGLNGIHN